MRKTKTFYIAEDIGDFEDIEGWNVYISSKPSGKRTTPIEITWSAPEPKIEITPSQLKSALDGCIDDDNNITFNRLGYELFGEDYDS